MRPQKTGIRAIVARFPAGSNRFKLRISQVSLRERSLGRIAPMLTYRAMTGAGMSRLQSALSTRSRVAGAMARGTSSLILCLAGMTLDLALDDRVADSRLLPMCGSVGATVFGVVAAKATGAAGGMLGLHSGAAVVALMSVCAACRTTLPGACWVRLITSILMVIAMWAGMFAGCFVAMRVAAFLRMPSATMLSWTMMALGMFIAHRMILLSRPASGFKLRLFRADHVAPDQAKS
jgi:hypothetical protein